MVRCLAFIAMIVIPPFWTCRDDEAVASCGVESDCCCVSRCGCELEAPDAPVQPMPMPPSRSLQSHVEYLFLAPTAARCELTAHHLLRLPVSDIDGQWMVLGRELRAVLCVWLT